MYRVVTDAQVQQQIDTLPATAVVAPAELRTALEVSPRAGEPINDQNPDSEVRTMTFGPRHDGLAAFLILDDQRRVAPLQITWLS